MRYPYYKPGVFSARDLLFGATCDGVTDDATAINRAVAYAGQSGGGDVLIDGGALVNSPIQISYPNVRLVGISRQGSYLKAGPTFTGTALVIIGANNCTVSDLALLGSSSSSSAASQAGNGIEVTGGARYAEMRNLEFQYLNGWAIEVAATNAGAPLGSMIDTIHVYHCAGGVHYLGNINSGFGIQAWASNLNLEIVDGGTATVAGGTYNMPCLLVEDAADVLVSNINGAAAQGASTNCMIHVHGACSSVYFTDVDLGMFPGPASAPIILIETGGNGDPAGIGFTNGVVQKGGPHNILVTSGGRVTFRGLDIKASQNMGASVTGSTGPVIFEGCQFLTNGASGAANNYDLNVTIAANWVYTRNCIFATAVGSGANTITNVINDANHRVYVFTCHFEGSGSTPSTVFNGTPQIVRNSPGYNPRGQITAPTIGASPFASSSSQHDVLIIFTAINTLTAFKIGGASVGVLPATGVPYFVAARQSLEVDYSGAAPTWQWIAN